MEQMKQREEEVAVEGMAIREAQARRASAIAHVIELEAVAAAYRDFAKLFEAALLRNVHLELRDLLRSIIEVIEWSEDPKDSKKGQALIQLFPLPVGLQAPKSKQPHDGSWGCLAWLPNRDNLRTEHGLVLTLPRASSRVEMARANARRSRRPRPSAAARRVPNPLVKARAYEAAVQAGSRSYAQVAKEFGVTREEVCQYVALVRRLPPEVVAHLDSEFGENCPSSMSLRGLLVPWNRVR